MYVLTFLWPRCKPLIAVIFEAIEAAPPPFPRSKASGAVPSDSQSEELVVQFIRECYQFTKKMPA